MNFTKKVYLNDCKNLVKIAVYSEYSYLEELDKIYGDKLEIYFDL